VLHLLVQHLPALLLPAQRQLVQQPLAQHRVARLLPDGRVLECGWKGRSS
jgi:hypothetical protein